MQKRSQRVWRRRECLSCGAIFTSVEAPLLEAAWLVQDRKGSLQPFSRDKLFLSIHNSCQHRQNALEDASSLVDTIIRKLASDGVDNARLWAGTIQQTASVALSRFDKAAGVHYQAFHKI